MRLIGNWRKLCAAGQADESEAECDATGYIKLVQVVVVTDDPATTPERVTPITAIIGSGEVSWSVFELTAQAKVLTKVVFRSSAQRKSKTGCAADACPVGRE